MKTTKPLSRKSLKRSQPKRDWKMAREYVEQEGTCRLSRSGDCSGPLETAHIIGRKHDFEELPGDHTILIAGHPIVWPIRVVPLCRWHHRMYDAYEIDLLPALDLEEQLQAVRDAGSLELARKRTAPSQYRSST